MTLENHHISRQKDSTDHSAAMQHHGAGNFGVDMTSPHFNRHMADSSKPDTASLPEMTITHAGNNDKNNGSQPSVRNIDASAGFHQQVTESYKQSFGHLSKDIQEKLHDSKVLTVNHTGKAIPGMPDVPAITPDKSEHKGNTMVFSEKGAKNQNAPINDVMNHEIFHTVDNAIGASKDPELRRAIDKGISQLSTTDQKHIAVQGKEQAAQRYAEFAGDIMALEMGSKPKDLAYFSKVHNSENSFREARELVRKKYMQ